MKIVLQRVSKAHLTSEHKNDSIQKGVVLFVGFQQGDSKEIIDKMVQKLFNIHYFSDTEGNKLGIEEAKAEVLIISQFTLFADVKKGRNPSWHKAAEPKEAKKSYDLFCQKVMEKYPKIKTGEFGAYMKIEQLNEGPFTLILDSQELFMKNERL